MVRVLSCYNFQRQDVVSVSGELSAICCSRDYLFMARDDASETSEEPGTVAYYTAPTSSLPLIEVRNLAKACRVQCSFNTISSVTQIIYSVSGNYIGTIEVKSVKSTYISFARIYINWECSSSEVKCNQAMKVRVSGHGQHQTSSSRNEQQLEVIEIPFTQSPTILSCCKETGNLVIGLAQSVCIYQLLRGAGDGSLIDFHHVMDVKFGYLVREVALCENYVAALSVNEIHIVNITTSTEQSVAWSKSESRCNPLDHPTVKHEAISEQNHSKDSKDSVADAVESQDFILWTFDDGAPPVMTSVEQADTITFRGIERENKYVDTTKEAKEILGPTNGIAGHSISIHVPCAGSDNSPCVEYSAVSMLYKRLPIDIMDTAIHSLHLYPIYDTNDQEVVAAMPGDVNVLKSANHGSLGSVTCLFSTSSEFYLYEVHNEPVVLLANTPFTSMCVSVTMSRYLVHAITSAGLETYTNRSVHSYLRGRLAASGGDDKYLCSIRCSDGDGSSAAAGMLGGPCLVSVKSFAGVTLMSCGGSDGGDGGEGHVVLVSTLYDGCSSPPHDAPAAQSTVYSVSSEWSHVHVYRDMVELGRAYQRDSPPTYYHLLCEGHLVLTDHLYSTSQHAAPPPHDEAQTLYERSCLLLADYHATRSSTKHWQLAATFYIESGVSVEEVLLRAIIQKPLESSCGEGLLYYLYAVLTGGQGPASHIDTEMEESSANTVLELFQHHRHLPHLLIHPHSALTTYDRKYAIELCEGSEVMQQGGAASSGGRGFHVMALASLHLSGGDPESALCHLSSISQDQVVQVARRYPQMIVSSSSSTEQGGDSCWYRLTGLARLMMSHLPDTLVNVLVDEVCGRRVGGEKLLRGYSVLVGAESGRCHQMLLETLLTDARCAIEVCDEACTILCKVYIDLIRDTYTGGRLVPVVTRKPHRHLPKHKRGYFGTRYSWLNSLPPFSSSSKPFQPCTYHHGSQVMPQDAGATHVQVKPCCICCCCNEPLVKLQSLLCHPGVKVSSMQHIEQYVDDQGRVGGGRFPQLDSAKVLCLIRLDQHLAITHIFSHYPHLTVQVAWDVCADSVDKWKQLYDVALAKLESMKSEDDGQEMFDIYNTVYKDVLSELVELLEPKELLQLLPLGSDVLYMDYLDRSSVKYAAKHLQRIIVDNGNKMLERL